MPLELKRGHYAIGFLNRGYYVTCIKIEGIVSLVLIVIERIVPLVFK